MPARLDGPRDRTDVSDKRNKSEQSCITRSSAPAGLHLHPHRLPVRTPLFRVMVVVKMQRAVRAAVLQVDLIY